MTPPRGGVGSQRQCDPRSTRIVELIECIEHVRRQIEHRPSNPAEGDDDLLIGDRR
jgi:hypothetical protein